MANRHYVNSDLERDVLRAILFNPNAVYAVTRVSNDPTFMADDKWTIVWRGMLRLVAEGKVIDPALVQSAIVNDGLMTATQARNTVETLVMASESDRHVEHWVDELFMFYQRRQLLDLAGQIEATVERGEAMDDIINSITRRVTHLTGMKQRVTIEEVAKEVRREVMTAHRTGIFRRGLMTPFPAFNHFTNGIGSNWLVIIGADSGIGKTTMAIQIADGVLDNTDKRVGIISLEMTPEGLVERMACSRSMLDHDKIKKGQFTPEEAVAFEKAMDELESFGDRFVVVTSQSFVGSPTAEKIASAIRVEHARNPLGLVVIDYFQLFAVGRVEEREDACRIINLVAKQLNIPIILLSQVNRNYIRERRRPEYTDLRGTSQLQNDPEVILMLDKVSKRVPRERWSMENIIEHEIDAYIDKNRHGAVGEFKLMFDGERYVFYENMGSAPATSTGPSMTDLIMGS